MAETPEIKVKLTAEDTGVTAAIKQLGASLKDLRKDQDNVASSGLNLSKVFGAVAASGLLIKLGEIGKEAFDSALNIGRMAEKTGVSSQALSVFYHAASQVGVSTEVVDKAVTKAAKSITQFQQGSVTAAQGFALLNISQKDFAGLSPDAKLALVTERLGGMAAGFKKTTAAQLIFSKGGADFIPIADKIASEGFGNITRALEKFGLLIDQNAIVKMRAAQEQLHDLSDIGAGMATQFEVGLLPAVTDVAKALLDSSIKGGSGFEQLGETAGKAIKGIGFTFFALGDSVGAIVEQIIVGFDGAWAEIKTTGGSVFAALGRAARGDFGGAVDALKKGIRDLGREDEEYALKSKAIWDQTAVDIQKKREDLFDGSHTGKPKPPPAPDSSDPEGIRKAPNDAAAHARFSLAEKQDQDRLALMRATAKEVEQIDLEAYDKGELSLSAYFDRRRAALAADAVAEVAILRHGVDAANQEAAKYGVQAKAAPPKSKERDELDAKRIEALTRVEELQTQIGELQINSAAKVDTLNTEEFKKRDENQKEVLEFHKLIDKTQGNALDAARAEIAVEQQRLQIILAQSGATQKEIDSELARYSAVTLAAASFTEKQKDGAAALKELGDERAAIEDKVATGKLYQIQGEQQIHALELARLPALQQISDELVAQAKASGDEQKIAAAEDFSKQVGAIRVQTDTVGQQVAKVKEGIQGSLTGGINEFFGSLVSGTRNVGQAFRSMAANVIDSLAKMATQMLATLVIQKLLGSATGAAGGGGGFLSSLFGAGHAEGGLIKGPGGPKSDSIPARVSPGEYIVKADAVKGFGVANLEAINRGLKIPSLEHLALPKFADGGLVGNAGAGSDSQIHLGIGLDEGLVLRHLSSKAAGNIILNHLANNPKAAGKALSRSQ